MTAPQLQALAQLFTERLLNTAAEGVLLAGLVWLLLRLVGRHNSGTRFVIWFSALLGIVALPFVSGAGASHFWGLHPANLGRQIVLSPSIALFFFAAWTIGAGLLLLRLSIGLRRVRTFRKKCSDLDLTALDPAVAGTLREFQSTRGVRVCVSSEAAVPAAIGFFRPAIVFPAWLLPQLSEGEIKTILLHELAHLRRGDGWTNLAQKIVKAAFFFHPAVWWIENRLTLEREMACDDMVLAETANPREYASSLISFAEKLHSGQALALAQALVSRMHQMSLRVGQILDAKRPRRSGLWKPALGLSAGMLVLVLGVTPYMPSVVAFKDQPNQNPTQEAQMVQSAANAEAQPTHARILPVSERFGPERVGSRENFAQARAIPAAFHPRIAATPLHLKARSKRKPALMNTSTVHEQLWLQETIVVLRTARYDSAGSNVWTLCIWRVEGNDAAEKQLQSAIVVSFI